MTETERWVNGVCEGIVSQGRVRLYKDLYKDLRERLPCAEACRLIAAGLRLTRSQYLPSGGLRRYTTCLGRAQAIAAMMRLACWDTRRQARADGLSTEETIDLLVALYGR